MEYINGKVTYSNKNYIVLEANSIGHKIYINDSMAFDNNQLYRIYIYIKKFLKIIKVIFYLNTMDSKIHKKKYFLSNWLTWMELVQRQH